MARQTIAPKLAKQVGASKKKTAGDSNKKRPNQTSKPQEFVHDGSNQLQDGLPFEPEAALKRPPSAKHAKDHK
ncbi:uncharacterized protein N7479_007552 [Penicillium vulpinum]|uniref:uncharacterized protein n=1 Tax=Penicillium vulpinum TaxID=29845 RepID=UPI0025473992|nr:uncharacterized protein N7479_007552 [Penicillium vulpinum]KAJ5960402.1 hypothetical protein N7479_007552 [Penicillium vulpinum]